MREVGREGQNAHPRAMRPTVVLGVTDDMTIAHEEIFGPCCTGSPAPASRAARRGPAPLNFAKPLPDGRTALRLTPLELIDRLAALIPPPRLHRHRYHGVLAPNAPLRAQVTAWARPPCPPLPAAHPAQRPECSPARYLWTLLLARIYEILP